jgi:hypothetical protein
MDEDGNPRVGQIIWHSTPEHGESFTIEGYSEDEIGFFVIENQYGPTPAFALSSVQSFLPPGWINLARQEGVHYEPGNADGNIPGSDPGTRLSFLDGDVQLTVNDETVGEEMAWDVVAPSFEQAKAESDDNDYDYEDYMSDEGTPGYNGTLGGAVDKKYDGNVADYGADGPEPYTGDSGDDLTAVFTFAEDLEGKIANLKGWNEQTEQYEDIKLSYEDAGVDYATILKGVTVGGQDIFAVRLYDDGWYDFYMFGAVEHEVEQHSGGNGGGQPILRAIEEPGNGGGRMDPDVAVLHIKDAIKTTDDDGDPVLLDFSIRIDDSVPVAESKYAQSSTDDETVWSYEFFVSEEQVGADGLQEVTVKNRDGVDMDVTINKSDGGWMVTFQDDAYEGGYTYTITDNDDDTATGTVNDFAPT